MTQNPFGGAFPHQHGDQRGLMERIHAQLRERIEDAVEMAGLKLMVERRERDRRPAPATSSATDRTEFEATVAALLAHLANAFRADLTAEQLAELDQAEAAPSSERERFLAGQVFLARRLADYWQRLEAYQAQHINSCLEVPAPKGGWWHHFLGSS